MTGAIFTLADREARLEAELAAVRRVRSTLAELRETFLAFPELRKAFASEIALLASNQEPDGVSEQTAATTEQGGPKHYFPTPVYTGTNVQKIADFLADVQRPVTVAQISAATHVPVSSVRHILYIRHPKRFMQVDGPAADGKAYWVLREQDSSQPDLLEDTEDVKEDEKDSMQ